AGGDLGPGVVDAVEVDDLAEPGLAREALDAVGFLVALEVRETAVTRVADVVFPVAPVTDKAGTFVNWEGRVRPFEQVFANPGSLPDLRTLSGIADELGRPLGFRTVEQAREEIYQIGPWDGARATAARVEPAPVQLADDEFVLASWRQMRDAGVMQDGDEHLRATARKPVVHVSAGTLAELGVAEGDPVVVRSRRGAVTLPVRVADVADRTVWAPANTGGTAVHTTLGPAGTPVRVERSAR